MSSKTPSPDFSDFERQHDVPQDTYCGLTPLDMSRAVVAYHSGPRKPGQPVGYSPIGSPETRLAWLREEFGPNHDVARLRLLEQVFSARVSQAIKLDWMLPNEDFDVAVMDGLRQHYPELTEQARWVIAGSFSYSHAQ